ncbi:MAG: hypothetical protein ACPHK8_05135 [Thermoplasmatota archaeon]
MNHLFLDYATSTHVDPLLTGKSRIFAMASKDAATENWFNHWYDTVIEGNNLYMPKLAKQAMFLRVLPQNADSPKLARALCTDFTQESLEHHRERLDNNANIFANYSGETGSGKSSCSLADGIDSGIYDCPVKTKGDLEARVFFDKMDVHEVMQGLGRRDVAFKDEDPRESGEGSLTNQKALMNLQDTIRGTQRSLHMASPELEYRATTQMEYQAIAQTPIKTFMETGVGETLFLVARGPHLLGYARKPWVNGQVFRWYSQIKDDYLQIALGGGRTSSRQMHFLELVLKRSPKIFERVAGLNKTETQEIIELVLSMDNVDSNSVKSVSRVIHRLLSDADAGVALAAEIMQDFQAYYGIELPSIV